MQTHTHTTYTFDELSEDAQQNVLEKYYDWNVQDTFWHECVTDDIKELAKLIGIEIDNIWFSGFSSQGDGAQFEGSYSYTKGGVKALKAYAPHETELHKIAEELQELQRKNFYALSAYVKHRGHYNHEMCTDIQTFKGDYPSYCYDESSFENYLIELLRDFMRYIYKRLESEYDYLTSEESLREYFMDSDYLQFDENGTLH